MQFSLVATALLVSATVLGATAFAAEDPPAAQAGKKHFVRCLACHSASATGRPTTGPHLEGIVGRQAASLADFVYSAELRSQDFVWDEARLDAFLKSPQATHPGMCLTFNGLPRPEDRAALIAYLKDPTQ